METENKKHYSKTEFQLLENTTINYLEEPDSLILNVPGMKYLEIDKLTYEKILKMDNAELTTYLNTRKDRKEKSTIRRFITAAKERKVLFFDIEPPEIKQIERKPYEEPEINKQIRDALRRTRMKA